MNWDGERGTTLAQIKEGTGRGGGGELEAR